VPQISDAELARLKQAVEELTTLNQIANAVNVSMSIDKITSIIVERCRKRVDASQGAIFLLDDTENAADRFRTFVRQTDTTATNVPFHLNNSLLGWMLKHKSILVSNSPNADDRLPGVNFDKLGIRSLIATPLLSRKGLTGLLVLFNKGGERQFDDRDERFLGIVSTQVAKVIENAKLFEQEVKLASIEKELKLAQSIQRGFLPKRNLSGENFEIYGFNEPAREVGGDYYDMIRLTESRIFVSLGDVAGKGLPAALLTGNAQAVLRSQLHRRESPDLRQLADCLNNLICDFTGADQYLTAVFGVFDAGTGDFRYVNAGHLPPVFLRRNGAIEKPDLANVVIGVLPDMPFDVYDNRLEQGDSVYLYTDGVTEALNAEGELYGDQRFESFLTKRVDLSPDSMCEQVRRELAAYTAATEQSDDITLVGIRRR
jgi:phosphoserine phosphatase RsbU/P